MSDSESDGGELPGVREELDWMSRGILVRLFDADGTADVSELRIALGEDNGGRINYRLSNILEPEGLVSLARPEADDGKQRAKVVSLSSTGRDVAESLKGLEEGEGDEEILPLDERLDRLEAALESEFGHWGMERQREFKITFQMMRVIRDYLAERDGEEFRSYVDENFDL